MNVFPHPDVSVDSAAGRVAGQLAALAHPARLQIVRHLAQAESCCCGEVVRQLDLAQSTTSQHLKVLVEAGLVTYAPNRRRSRYALDRQALAGLSETLSSLVASCCEPK
jgi:DNA-binding transcriptional ArsR family regulator